MTFRTVKTKRFFWLAIYSCASFLILFQSRWALGSSFGFDESCYLEYFHKFLGETFPMCYSKSLFWGAPLTWLPFGILIKLISKLFVFSFTELALPVIGIFSYLQWVLALFVFDRIATIISQKHELNKTFSPHLVFCAFLTIPVIANVFRWNFMSHASELILVSLTFYFLLSGRVILAIIFSIWTFVTRLNDIGLILVVLGAFWDNKLFSMSSKLFQKTLIGVVTAGVAFAALKLWNICFVTGYNGFYLTHVIHAFQWDGVRSGFLNPYHGLVWYDFFWLFSTLYFTAQVKKISHMQRGILLWQYLLIFIHVSQHVFWGYSENRLFVGAYVANLINLWMYLPKMSRFFQRFFIFQIVVTAFWRVWYFLAATAPGLRYWSEVLGHKEESFLVAALGMLLKPQKTIEITAGLSPIGFELLSWGKNWPIFSRYQTYLRYTISSVPLWIVTLFTIIVIVMLVYLIIGLAKSYQLKRSPMISWKGLKVDKGTAF